MVKISALAGCLLALSGGLALAQNSMSGWMPAGPNDAPGGANGAARTRSIGQGDPNVNDTGDSRTTSSTFIRQQMKRESAGYYGSQAMASDSYAGRGPRRICITDEYGFKYDARGDRLDARGNVISPHTR